MYRTHDCGALSLEQLNQTVTLAGWVQKNRNKGFIVWIDLRDRYGITQLVFDEERTPKEVFKTAQGLGREFVIQVKGTVIERESKNPNMATGAIEVLVEELKVLNTAKTPLLP
jgi:aspartyl-tRNA synthetase